MDYLLQFCQPTPLNFSITNIMCTPIQSVQINSIADKSNNDDKERASFNNNYYSCTYPECGKTFRYKSEFTRHSLTHASQRLISCPIEGCAKTFKRSDALKNHMRTHTGERPYKCEEPGCGQSFAYRASLSYHSLKHTVGKEYKCSFQGCNRTFFVMSQLRQHENTLNYHERLINQTPSQDENQEHINNIHAKKCENTTFYAGSVARETKLEVEVEMKEDIIKDENASNSREEELKRRIKALVYQNSVMKMKLNMVNRLREFMQKKKRLPNQHSNEKASECHKFEVKSE